MAPLRRRDDERGPTYDPAMRITGIDHVVFTVSDVERSAAWYRDVLGLEVLRLEEWRARQVPFVSVRLSPTALIDLMQGDRSGENVDHVALLVEGDMETHLHEQGINGDGPHQLYGAQGVGQGVYIRDPDDNTIELRTY